MGLEHWALTVSIVSAVIAITSIIQAMVLRKVTEKENKQASESLTHQSEEALSFLTHLVVNSAPDPDTVRRMLEDYSKVGEWRAKVSRRPDGKYGLDFAIQVGGGDVKPSGKLEKHKE